MIFAGSGFGAPRPPRPRPPAAPRAGRRPFVRRPVPQALYYPVATPVVAQQPFCVGRYETDPPLCSGSWVVRDIDTMCCVP